MDLIYETLTVAKVRQKEPGPGKFVFCNIFLFGIEIILREKQEYLSEVKSSCC